MQPMFTAALSAIYRTLGVYASFDFCTEPFLVIDKTAGFEVTMPGSDIPTVVQGICIRVADITVAGYDVEEFIGAMVDVNGKHLEVVKHLPRPTPEGESKGEYLLTTREVA